MANQIINVVVNSKGAVTVIRELDAMGASAKSTATYLNGLRAVLAAALTFSGAGQIIETINTFTALQNRLRQVADANMSVNESWTKLLQIANSSYSAIDSTVDLYFRVAQAYKAWGQSAKEAMEFTELFQKSAILSGSTMQTTTQAVYQFGQALNKGKLDGDEFRSVLEGLPYVANIIQKSLGVTRAELYQMSKEGKISVDRIKQAFEEAAKTIQSDWKNITPTIGMAIQVLKNNWTDFIGSIETSTGIFSGFAYLILAVANNFTLLAIALTPVAISLGFLAGRLGIGLVVMGFKDLVTVLREATIVQWLFNAAVSANPYVIAVAAIVAVVAALVYFRNELGLTNEVLTAIWGTITSTFTSLIGYLTSAYQAVAPVLQAFLEWNVVFIAIRAAASLTMADIVAMFTAISEAVQSFVGYMRQALGPLFTSLIELATAFYNLVMDIVNLYAEAFAPAIKITSDAFKSMWEYVGPTLMRFVGFLKDIFDGWKLIASFLKSNFLPAVKAVFEGWLFLIKSVVDGISKIINFLRTAISLFSQLSGMGGGGAAPGAHYGAQFKAGEGFANGGAFKVPGTNSGRDSTPVSFRAERGERVTVETKKQQRQSDNSNQAPSVNVPITNVTVLDPNMMVGVMSSAAGQRVHLNTIKDNASEIKQMLGIV